MNQAQAAGVTRREKPPVTPVFILGYGNPDRQDDGVAWHVLTGVAQRLGIPVPEEPGDPFESPPGGPRFEFMLQLTPELAEDLVGYAHVCFVDAHTGAVPRELQRIRIHGEIQSSPFTHHMTPQSLLAITRTLYGKEPLAFLVSVLGYQFGFDRSLSEKTAGLAGQASDWIAAWAANPLEPPSYDS